MGKLSQSKSLARGNPVAKGKKVSKNKSIANLKSKSDADNNLAYAKAKLQAREVAKSGDADSILKHGSKARTEASNLKLDNVKTLYNNTLTQRGRNSNIQLEEIRELSQFSKGNEKEYIAIERSTNNSGNFSYNTIRLRVLNDKRILSTKKSDLDTSQRWRVEKKYKLGLI